MVRYLGPKLLKLKSFGSLPGFKIVTKKENSHGLKSLSVPTRSKKLSDYGLRLKEKQKIRYNYGISEIQLINYIKRIQYLSIRTAYDLRSLIEFRLDVIVYNLGFSITIAGARQLISHGKIFVNSKKVNISSFICKLEDIIVCNLVKKQKEYFLSNILNTKNLPDHLIKLTPFCGRIINDTLTDVNLSIDERLVLEFYSKR